MGNLSEDPCKIRNEGRKTSQQAERHRQWDVQQKQADRRQRAGHNHVDGLSDHPIAEDFFEFSQNFNEPRTIEKWEQAYGAIDINFWGDCRI